jgi:hypothetical protein
LKRFRDTRCEALRRRAQERGVVGWHSSDV